MILVDYYCSGFRVHTTKAVMQIHHSCLTPPRKQKQKSRQNRINDTILHDKSQGDFQCLLAIVVSAYTQKTKRPYIVSNFKIRKF